jgi:hypothetical protein
MRFTKTTPANMLSYAFPLSPIAYLLYYLSFFLSFSSFTHYILSIFHSSFPNPASSPAGRAPPYGGIARPQGKHSRHKGVLCLPTADLPARIGIKFTKG